MRTLPNGRSKGLRPQDFDPIQLRRGMRVEREHTTDPRIAQRIAMDHLTEDPAYYRKLATLHLGSAVTASCAASPRWLRGGIGAGLGSVLGATVGATVGAIVVDAKLDLTSPLDSLRWIKNAKLITLGTSLVGMIAGLLIGAYKPEC